MNIVAYQDDVRFCAMSDFTDGSTTATFSVDCFNGSATTTVHTGTAHVFHARAYAYLPGGDVPSNNCLLICRFTGNNGQQLVSEPADVGGAFSSLSIWNSAQYSFQPPGSGYGLPTLGTGFSLGESSLQLVAAIASPLSPGVPLYVSPFGNDSNNGTIDQPLATVVQAVTSAASSALPQIIYDQTQPTPQAVYARGTAPVTDSGAGTSVIITTSQVGDVQGSVNPVVGQSLTSLVGSTWQGMVSLIDTIIDNGDGTWTLYLNPGFSGPLSSTDQIAWWDAPNLANLATDVPKSAPLTSSLTAIETNVGSYGGGGTTLFGQIANVGGLTNDAYGEIVTIANGSTVVRAKDSAGNALATAAAVTAIQTALPTPTAIATTVWSDTATYGTGSKGKELSSATAPTSPVTVVIPSPVNVTT